MATQKTTDGNLNTQNENRCLRLFWLSFDGALQHRRNNLPLEENENN
jgi:hypothetical protein